MEQRRCCRRSVAHAYAARTFDIAVAKQSGSCPSNLLPLAANPIGPAMAAALLDDRPSNRPQVTGAMIARSDTMRGPQVKTECGGSVWHRTVVV